MGKKNNDTFGVEDEWFLEYGPQLTAEQAALITLLQWKFIKRDIQKKRAVFDAPETKGIWKYEATHAYKGLLWHYKEVILRFKLKPGEKPAPDFKKPSFKMPKI